MDDEREQPQDWCVMAWILWLPQPKAALGPKTPALAARGEALNAAAQGV